MTIGWKRYVLLGLVALGATVAGLTPRASAEGEEPVTFNPKKFTNSPKHVEYFHPMRSSQEAIWTVIGDPARLPEYHTQRVTVEIDHRREKSPNGVGCVRACTFPSGTTIHEKFVFVDEPHRVAWSITNGNVFGFTNHLAVMSIVERDGEMGLLWEFYFKHQDAERMARGIQGSLPRFSMNIDSLASE